MRRLSMIALVAALAITLLAPALARAQAAGLDEALAWLRGQQQPDGSFPGFGPGDTADAVIALVAAGESLDDYAQGDNSPISYLQAQAAGYATAPGAAAKLAMAAVAGGADPTSFGGVNLLELIGQGYDPATGQYGPDLYGHALALLGIKAVGATPPTQAIDRLLDMQLADGGWSFDGTEATGSDTNTTSLVLQALAGERRADGARAQALLYLESQQNDDGGFPYSQASSFGNASDTNSTAAAAMALVAAGERPTDARWLKGGQGPLDALRALQNDGGAFRYQADQAVDNALATYQAIPALAGAALPVRIAQVSGAQAAIAPAGTAQPVTGLPATAATPGVSLAALAILALALLGVGAGMRRVRS